MSFEYTVEKTEFRSECQCGKCGKKDKGIEVTLRIFFCSECWTKMFKKLLNRK